MATDLDKSYLQLINELKDQIKTARVKAHLAVNREMVLLYFKIGESILKKQAEEGWGAKITQRISRDLSIAFPEMTGLSYTNIRYMQRFAEFCSSICPQAVGKLEELPLFEIPWGHNREIMDSVKDLDHLYLI